MPTFYVTTTATADVDEAEITRLAVEYAERRTASVTDFHLAARTTERPEWWSEERSGPWTEGLVAYRYECEAEPLPAVTT